MIITVCSEWPTGSEIEEIELPDNSTEEEIEEAAREAFFNNCNYGWSVKESGDD